MKTTQTRIQRIYTPLSWSSSIDTLGTQLSQSFKEDEAGESAYVPNRRLTPSVIQPIIRVHDEDGIFRNGIVNDLLADMHWYDGSVELTGADYTIDTSNTFNRGRITIHRNTPSGNPQTLRFEAVIADYRRGENVKVSVGGIGLNTTDVATDKYEVVANIPASYLYNPLTGVDSLSVTASAFRGTIGAAALVYELRKIVGTTERAINATDHEVTSVAADTFVFNPKLIQNNQYAIIGKRNGIEVGRYLFSITRSYPKWEATQAGAADMEPGQVRVADSVVITSNSGVVTNAEEYFSIQPHTVTPSAGDINWGERMALDINAFDAGFQDGCYVGIYFEVNPLPCMEVALDDDGTVFLDDDGSKLII